MDNVIDTWITCRSNRQITDRQNDRWMDKQTDIQNNKWMDKQTDGRTNRQTDGWTDKQMDRQTNSLLFLFLLDVFVTVILVSVFSSHYLTGHLF